MEQNLGKTSKDSPITLDQIKKEIEYCEAKIRDNCNIQAQLKKEDKALRETIKLLKHKRTELIFAPFQEAKTSEA
jgi:septal ring factor EnvC (AmiA/AmiB activator)